MRYVSPSAVHNAKLSIAIVVFGLLLGCDKSDLSGGASSGSNSAAQAPLAPGQLAGLYVRQQMIPMSFNGRMTFNLRREFFYFFPDGHVLFGSPIAEIKERPAAADFAAYKDVAPEKRGTYTIKDNQITFKPEKGDPHTEPFSIPKAGDDSVLQIGPPSTIGSVKAMPFKDGQKIDGSYQYDGTVGLGGDNTIFNVKTLAFHSDGTLASDQLSGVDTKGIDTKAGNSGVTTGGNTTAEGTYQLSGYTLTTTINGKSEKQTAFRWAGDDKPETPGLLCIAGKVYSRQEAKK